MSEQPSYDELLRANETLRRKVEWLESMYDTHKDEAVGIKTRFLSHVSHEIRTPMNAIMGFANLLQQNEVSPEEKDEYLFYIAHNSQALLKVLDNIIELTLLESQNLKLNHEEVCLKELIHSVHDYYNSDMVRTTKQRVALLMNLPPKLGKVTVVADGYRLRRVLENLVANALSQQNKGVVEIKLEIPDKNRVVFTVRSDANTLLRERAKMIFENSEPKDDNWFNQLDNTGLSYVLVRDLTRAMGGTIDMINGEAEDKGFGLRVVMPVKELSMTGKNGSVKDVKAIMI